MSESFALACPAHRSALRAALDALRDLQGEAALPLEHRIIQLVEGVYDLRVFEYPLPLTAVHLRAAERLPHVIRVEINPSMEGITPGVFGALCVQLDLTSLGSVKRAAAAADSDSDDDDADTFTDRRRRGPAKASTDESLGALGWIQSLFSVR